MIIYSNDPRTPARDTYIRLSGAYQVSPGRRCTVVILAEMGGYGGQFGKGASWVCNTTYERYRFKTDDVNVAGMITEMRVLFG